MQMRIEEVHEASGCFPRLGFRENVESTAFVVCPKKDGPMMKSLVRIQGNERAMFQISNIDNEEFKAELTFRSKLRNFPPQFRSSIGGNRCTNDYCS